MSAEQLKRVSFMTIDSSTDLLKKPEKEPSTTAAAESKTIRLELEIYEPDARKNSDFNYKRLIHIEKKKQKKLAKISNGAPPHEKANNPFGGGGDDEDDIARIAREMEAKYGTGSSYGGKSGANDFDRGVGYDDNDSFIDNTEAYDEIIPEDVDTARGGFYVNSGLLEFKKIPNFERPGDEIRMPKAKKRALSTSSESSDGEDRANTETPSASKSKKKKKHAEKKVKSATSSSDEQGKAAKKAKKDKQEKMKPVVESPAPVSATAASAATPSPAVVKEQPEKKKVIEKEATPAAATDDSKKIVKTTTVKDMLRAKRDNLRKMEQGKSSGGTTTTTDNDDDDGSESLSSLAVSESSRDSHHAAEVNGAPSTAQELSLPSTFSPDLIKLITNLKQYADTALKSESNFFDNHVKEQLLQIDTIAKSQSQQVRLEVYKQLETFVPCTKKTILMKVSRYRTQHAEGKIKHEIKKLKAIVNDAMPELVRKYDEDQKTYENLRDMQQIVGGDQFELKSPRKKYHWNDSSRQILSDAMLYIHELFKISKVKKETLEEFSMRYLKEQLLPLWPEGWIKFEDFQKELERKKKRDARTSQGSNTSPSQPSSVNGKQSSHTPSQSPHQSQQQQQSQPQQPQKTESRSKELDLSMSTINGKTTTSAAAVQLSPQSSVIKKSSDHSINSIMSASPSPPIHSTTKTAASSPSTSLQGDTKPPRIIDLEKLSSPNDLLKVSQKDVARNIQKYSQLVHRPSMSLETASPEKVHRISDGSDSDCAIIDSPIKPTTPINLKPQQPQQQQFSPHLNNNKLNHSPVLNSQQQQQQPPLGGEMKKTKKHDNDYSSLIKNIASLTNPKTNSSQSFLSSPSMGDQRKIDNSSHGMNGTLNSEHFMDPPPKSMKNTGYNSNLHYSINELIVNTSRSGSHDGMKGNPKSSEYQKYTSPNNSHVHNNISVITSTNDVVNNNNFSMSPVLNLSNKK